MFCLNPKCSTQSFDALERVRILELEEMALKPEERIMAQEKNPQVSYYTVRVHSLNIT